MDSAVKTDSLPQFISQPGAPLPAASTSRYPQHNSGDGQSSIFEKIEYLLSGFNYVKTELREKQFIDPFRNYDLLLKFQEKEFLA